LTNARESETDFEALCVLLSDTYEHASHAHAGKDTEPPVMWADTAMHHRVATRAALRAVLVELGLTPAAGVVIAGPCALRWHPRSHDATPRAELGRCVIFMTLRSAYAGPDLRRLRTGDVRGRPV
jgi:hypothetical protein